MVAVDVASIDGHVRIIGREMPDHPAGGTAEIEIGRRLQVVFAEGSMQQLVIAQAARPIGEMVFAPIAFPVAGDRQAAGVVFKRAPEQIVRHIFQHGLPGVALRFLVPECPRRRQDDKLRVGEIVQGYQLFPRLHARLRYGFSSQARWRSSRSGPCQPQAYEDWRLCRGKSQIPASDALIRHSIEG